MGKLGTKDAEVEVDTVAAPDQECGEGDKRHQA
jgi:hypothetical protein